jgi:WD40 repeat protein
LGHKDWELIGDAHAVAELGFKSLNENKCSYNVEGSAYGVCSFGKLRDTVGHLYLDPKEELYLDCGSQCRFCVSSIGRWLVFVHRWKRRRCEGPSTVVGISWLSDDTRRDKLLATYFLVQTLLLCLDIQLWSFSSNNTASLVRSFTGHTDSVSSLAVARDGTVFSGSQDGHILAWNGTTGAQKLDLAITPLFPRQGGINSLVVIPAGGGWNDRLVSAHSDYYVRVWDAKTGALIANMTGHADVVYSLTVLPDRSVVSGSADGSLGVWDSSTGALSQPLVKVSSFWWFFPVRCELVAQQL